MTVFLVLGGVGLAILVLSLVLGDLLDGVFEGLDALFDSLDFAGGGTFSGPVLGAFLGAFGLGGALLSHGTGLGPVAATFGGLLLGGLVGWLALWLTRALLDLPTDPPVRIGDLRGRSGHVVTPIPLDGMGEVTVRHAGQRLKLHARADGPLPLGTEVVVVEVLSTSSVRVADEADLFGR